MKAMDIPNQLPIIYTKPILIPGYIVKIKLQDEKDLSLLNYLLEDNKNPEAPRMIGLIPKLDSDKVDNVIGTVGLIRSVIQIDSVRENSVLLIEGICRFKLDTAVLDEPFKVNKIILIENFKDLLGDEKEKKELQAELEKVLSNYLVYPKPGSLITSINENTKIFFKTVPMYETIEYCLKSCIRLTPADAYKVLRATSLNNLLKLVIDLLKRAIINKHALYKCNQTDLVAMPPKVVFNLVENRNVLLKKSLTPELKAINLAIMNSEMPKSVYDLIMKEFDRVQDMSSHHPDYSILINYVSYVVNLPWNKSTEETLDLEKAKHVLQLNHYGMEKVKKRILEFIAVQILNPEKQGPILCFIGPPGVGKTTIAKDIAVSLNRTFKRISLGGINHFSDIKGHRKTYIGAMPGCIIQAINQVQTKNPIILLDEIDKMCKGSNGDPAAALLEVLDPEQNGSFVDWYLNLPFDLSQVMFVSTANNPSHIPQTLRDRMEIIYLEGYSLDEKMQIAENYLIPKIFKNHKMKVEQINIYKNTTKDIIQKYTCEAGVRDLQRKLEAVCRYIAIKMVENGDREMKKNYVVPPELLVQILGNRNYGTNTLIEQCCDRVGVAIGLSWTPAGGQIQVVETSKLYSGNEKKRFVLTGLAGQTLKESVEIALNWIQSFVQKSTLNINDFCVHVHLPEGAHKKDGPSAGITVVCALVSLFWKVPLKQMIAMTGEISLKGYVLPVGGVKAKILAAYNSNIKTVIIPELNMKDTKSLPKNVREDLTVIPVKHLEDVLDIVIPGGLEFLQNPSLNVILSSKI